MLKLAAGSSAQTVLPFTDLDEPRGVAVDGGGAVYVVNYEHSYPRVLKLTAGFDDERAVVSVTWPRGVAVDSGGTVYITDTANDRVVKLAARCIDNPSAHPGTPWSCKHAVPVFF